MLTKRPQPPRPDRTRSIRGSFSWIDYRFFREGFDQGLTRLEKLLYLVLVAVSNRDGVSFYSGEFWVLSGYKLRGPAPRTPGI